MASSDTQHKSTVPIAENTRTATSSAQYLLETTQDRQTPVFHANNLELYICGEKSFEQIAKDIREARSSVDIICWGFDPAMELARSGTAWPRGETWGGLLRDVAAGKHNGGKPVQVRVLAWYGFIGNKGTNNLPGYGKDAAYDVRNAVSRGMAGAVMPGGREQLPLAPRPTDPKEQREVFNAHWYKDAFNGELKNIAIRTRDGDSKAVSESLKGEPGERSWTETLGMEQVATDHQKTILIDYEHEGGAHAVGYVMGLNSVTDYWDTEKHLFNDPLRGAAWEGAGDSEPGLKPYQDYACRIQGAALVAVSKNFTDAWNRAKCSGKGGGTTLSRAHDVQKPPAGLSRRLNGALQRAQIVRTQPEEGDKSIKRLYQQASSFARNYLYIENQYFQYTDWAQQLKQVRASYLKGWQAAGKSPADLPNLHVMVVIPTPERKQMVPRTHDTVAALGHGNSMPNQDKKIDDELKAYQQDKEHYDKIQAVRAKDPLMLPPPHPPKLSPLVADHQAATEKGNVKDMLGSIGLHSLIGSLWTYDSEWRTTQKKEMERLKEWEDGSTRDKDGKILGPMAQRVNAQHDQVMSARYREIYIHSKLMIIDDSFFTLGSANLNLRSMAVDAEINVASDDVAKSTDLRWRVWDMMTGSKAGCNPGELTAADMKNVFDEWQRLMSANAKKKTNGEAPTGFLMPFEDKRTSSLRLA